MTRVMKKVKRVEDDLVKKESELEQKVKEEQESKDGAWGTDHVHMPPLSPHFRRPQNL